MRYDNGDNCEKLEITFVENGNTVKILIVNYEKFTSSELIFTSLIATLTKLMGIITVPIILVSILLLFKHLNFK